MTAVLYLAIAIVWGSAVCLWVFPNLAQTTKKSFDGRQLSVSSLFVLVPAWIYLGLIPMTWCVYLLSYLFRNTGDGMRVANPIAMLLFLAGAVGMYLAARRKKRHITDGMSGLKLSRAEWVFLVLVCALAISLFWTTFRVEDNTLYVGLSVFSDFSPHLGMIRSFSSGNNFPTAYSHFAGADIKYHFMFQFLAGNLEYLGMRLDYAFNLPSLLGFVSTFSLLYVLAAKITARKWTGLLACLFFTFRSSFSVFRYLGEQDGFVSLWDALFGHSDFVSYSTHEDWGLWNLNVYCNQRHLAFTLGVQLLVLILFLPGMYQAFERLKREWSGRKGFGTCAVFWIKRSLLGREGWRVEEPVMAVTAGLLLGMLAFWNGAVTIAALLVLFVLAIASDRRLEYLIAAAVTGALSMLQTSFFIEGNAVSTTLLYGFIAENPTFFGVLDYVYRLTGALLIVVAAVFLVADGPGRYVTIAFSAPFVFAFHISLTTDVTVNHKYIMISLMLLGIIAAEGIARLWETKRVALRAGAAVLVLILTATGIFEYAVVLNRNQKIRNLAYDMNDPLTGWVRENATAQDIFLTSNYALHPVVLGGAMLFDGWQYFAWSAGYDTASRDFLVWQMYSADNSEALKQLTKENNIRYIVVDQSNRSAAEYELREDIIEQTFAAVYSQGEGEWNTTIYDVSKPLR